MDLSRRRCQDVVDRPRLDNERPMDVVMGWSRRCGEVVGVESEEVWAWTLIYGCVGAWLCMCGRTGVGIYVMA